MWNAISRFHKTTYMLELYKSISTKEISMPYSVNVKGEILDYHYKKLTAFSYAFYIGDILIGQLFNMKRSWSAVSHIPFKNIGLVHGFKTRFDACQYLLQLQGYIQV